MHGLQEQVPARKFVFYWFQKVRRNSNIYIVRSFDDLILFLKKTQSNNRLKLLSLIYETDLEVMHLNICNGSWADHFISRGGGIRTPLTPYSSPRMQLLWLWMRSVKILLFTLVSFYITCWSNPRMFWKQQWRNEARECLDMVRWGNSTSMQLSDI